MPAPAKRPGALTFLAGLNFAFAACWAIAVLILRFVINLKNDPTSLPQGLEERTIIVVNAAMALPAWLLWERVVGGIFKILLWVGGGIAYLRMRRVGRTLGTIYAVFSLAEGVLGIAVGSPVVAELIGCLFPAITLVLVNVVFKDVLTR